MPPFFKNIPLIGTILVALVLGFFLIKALNRPPDIITQIDTVTRTVEVPVDRITTRTVTRYIPQEDVAAVEALLKENAELKVRVEQLSVSVAKREDTISGPVTTIPATDATPQLINYKDWRLNFQSDGVSATYTLSQQFSIVNTVGRNDYGIPVHQIRLYEMGPEGERLPITTVSTTTIATQTGQYRWYVSPRLQAGVQWTAKTVKSTLPSQTTTKTELVPGGMVALPWLYRGTSKAVGDTRYAFLTPVFTFNATETTYGILPVSFNFGSVRYLPFTDVWASPYIGKYTETGAVRIGIAISTTF